MKHPVLASVVEYLSAQPRVGPFIYAEGHTGRAQYCLAKGGEWEKGIKDFSSSPLVMEARESWKEANKEVWKLPHLKPYAETCFLEPARAGTVYPGSSKIVFRLLWKKGVPFRFHLWENDVAVCQDLFKDYPQWAQIAVCRGNGLDGVASLKKASLVLIDPFSIEDDAEAVLHTLDILADHRDDSGSQHGKGIPFICWTPLVGHPEEPVQSNFRTRTQLKGYAVTQVAWAKWPEKHFWGCQLTVPPSLEDVVSKTVQELLAVMTRWRTVCKAACLNEPGWGE